MLLNQVLFGKFTPPPAINVRRYLTIGSELFDEGYIESPSAKYMSKRKAQRKEDCDKAYRFILSNPETTASKLAIEFQWGHNKASCILDALILSKKIKRRGVNPRASGAKTYFYVVT